MRFHHSKTKGDTAVAAVILDLTKKGYTVSVPLSEHAAYDLIADCGKLVKIQVKCRADGRLPDHTVWVDKNGNHRKPICDKEFDYYALVNTNFDKIAYCPSSMKGKNIRFEHPNTWSKYFFWEDFSDFSESIPAPRKLRPVGRIPYGRRGKVTFNWPSDEEMQQLVLLKPATQIAIDLGVSDSAVGKHCKKQGIDQPPRGYWLRRATT